MILHCNYEELQALASASELIVTDAYVRGGTVAAPPDRVVMVEQLMPRLTGDMTIETLEDQRRVQGAVSFIVDDLHRRLDDKMIEYHPAHEEAVALYFDYGHSRVVLNRLDHMGAEMAAIADLISGGNTTAAGGITFPD